MSYTWQTVKQDRLRKRVLSSLGLMPYLERCEAIELGELPLHCELYQFSPEAPTIIFLPGIGTYSQLYCELLSRMSDQGFNLVAVDIRGHGCSGGQRGGYKVSEVVTDIRQLLDQLEPRFRGRLASLAAPLAPNWDWLLPSRRSVFRHCFAIPCFSQSYPRISGI